MKHLKKIGLIGVAAMALAAFAASSASATVLEVKGATKEKEPVTITGSLEPNTSALLQTTSGGFANTCTSSHLKMKTVEPFRAETIGGPISELWLSSCTTEKVEVHQPGSLDIKARLGTTNGTLTWTNGDLRIPSPVGTLICKSSAVDIGVLTGKESGQATIDLSAVLNCGLLVPSLTWIASYVITSPEGLGVEEII